MARWFPPIRSETCIMSEQKRIGKPLGCGFGQGYFFDRPLEAAEVSARADLSALRSCAIASCNIGSLLVHSRQALSRSRTIPTALVCVTCATRRSCHVSSLVQSVRHSLNQVDVRHETLQLQEFVDGGRLSPLEHSDKASSMEEPHHTPCIDDVQHSKQVPGAVLRLNDRSKDPQEIQRRSRRHTGRRAPDAKRPSRDTDPLPPRRQRPRIRRRVGRHDNRVGESLCGVRHHVGATVGRHRRAARVSDTEPFAPSRSPASGLNVFSMKITERPQPAPMRARALEDAGALDGASGERRATRPRRFQSVQFHNRRQASDRPV
jgi:hypothetical protein